MPGPAAATQTTQATQAAVETAVNTPPAQAISGTVATVAATPAGAVGVTLGQNAGFSAAGTVVTSTPELPGIAWLVTFAFQGLKHHHKIDQDRHKWFLLPILAFAFGLAIFMLTSHGDVLNSIARALSNCGLAAVNAATNYTTARPLGIFSSADELSTAGG